MLHAKESGISSGRLGLWLACTFTFPLPINKKVMTCIITICQCRETVDWKNENNPPHCEESVQPATNKNNTSLHTLWWCADNRFIMVIEMSRLQIGLKSYAQFLKSNERAAQVRFDITNMISDQNCTTQSLITTSLHPLWNRRIQSAPIFHRSSSWFVEKQKQRGFHNIHFVFKTEMMRDRAKMVWFSQNRNDAI